MIKQQIAKFMNTRFGWGLTAVFPSAFISIAESCVQILTLGYYTPPWVFKWMSVISLFHFKLKKQND